MKIPADASIARAGDEGDFTGETASLGRFAALALRGAAAGIDGLGGGRVRIGVARSIGVSRLHAGTVSPLEETGGESTGEWAATYENGAVERRINGRGDLDSEVAARNASRRKSAPRSSTLAARRS